MDFALFFDLYQDWKDLAFTKELFESIVKQLKEKKGGIDK